MAIYSLPVTSKRRTEQNLQNNRRLLDKEKALSLFPMVGLVEGIIVACDFCLCLVG